MYLRVSLPISVSLLALVLTLTTVAICLRRSKLFIACDSRHTDTCNHFHLRYFHEYEPGKSPWLSSSRKTFLSPLQIITWFSNLYAVTILLFLHLFPQFTSFNCYWATLDPLENQSKCCFVEPASCSDVALSRRDGNAPVKPESYSVLPKHDGEPHLCGTVIEPDVTPRKL